jgi:hypothetical protein
MIKKCQNRDVEGIFNLYSSYIIAESKKEAKQYLEQGKITAEDYETLLNIDPSDTKKYTGWLARQFISGEKNIDNLRNTIEEFDTFVRKSIIKGNESNIQSYKSFKDLASVVRKYNQEGSNTSKKQSRGDFDVVVDNEDLRIVVPYTHEASRKLGLTPIEKGGFAFRDCEGGGKDSAWCTTYSTSTHWDDYYNNRFVDFFYILIKSDQLKSKLQRAGFKPEAYVMALARLNINDYKERNLKDAFITQNNEGERIAYDAYDGKDRQLNKEQLGKWMNIVGIS